jgi:hypothetical protein
MQDVTRAGLDEDGQNLLTNRFLAFPHVCDTIEGLMLAYYELLYKCLYKIDKRLVVSIVLHQVWRVAQEVERFCVESCNGCQAGHPSQRQHDCLMMNENERWQMYGLQAIERVNGKGCSTRELSAEQKVTRVC